MLLLENNVALEVAEKIIKHLKERVKAINLDKERIEKIFPKITEKLNDDQT